MGTSRYYYSKTRVRNLLMVCLVDPILHGVKTYVDLSNSPLLLVLRIGREELGVFGAHATAVLELGMHGRILLRVHSLDVL